MRFQQNTTHSACCLCPITPLVVFVGPAGSYVSGSALVVDGAQWLYKKPGVPMDVVLKASRGEHIPNASQGA